MKNYSLDLREKIVAVYDQGGISQQKLAERFCVSVFFVKKLFRQRRLQGSIAPLIRSGWQKGLVTPEVKDYLVKLYQANNQLKLSQLADQIEAQFNLRLSNSTICRLIKSLQLRRKSK